MRGFVMVYLIPICYTNYWATITLRNPSLYSLSSQIRKEGSISERGNIFLVTKYYEQTSSFSQTI